MELDESKPLATTRPYTLPEEVAATAVDRASGRAEVEANAPRILYKLYTADE